MAACMRHVYRYIRSSTYYASTLQVSVRRHFGNTVRHFATLAAIRNANWQFAGDDLIVIFTTLHIMSQLTSVLLFSLIRI